MRRTPSRAWLRPKGHRGPEPFDLFSELARQALELAQQDARERQHGYIGTEHLLEGLVRVEEGNAAKVLSALSVGSEDLRRRLAEIVRPEPSSSPVAQPQPTKRMKRVMSIAFDEAKRLESGYLGTEHLLLGILIEGEGVAAHALRESGVTEQTVRDELERLVDEGSEEPS
jgi:ATP-dependent Clp protease ATP-binding subunit ClpC